MRPSTLFKIAPCLPLLFLWTGCATTPPEPVTPAASKPIESTDAPGLPAAWTLHRIADPEAAEHTAFSLLVPEGWAVEGGLSWSSPELYAMPTLLDIRVAGPDGRAARLYPQLTFSYGQEFARLHQPGQPTDKARCTSRRPKTWANGWPSWPGRTPRRGDRRRAVGTTPFARSDRTLPGLAPRVLRGRRADRPDV